MFRLRPSPAGARAGCPVATRVAGAGRAGLGGGAPRQAGECLRRQLPAPERRSTSPRDHEEARPTRPQPLLGAKLDYVIAGDGPHSSPRVGAAAVGVATVDLLPRRTAAPACLAGTAAARAPTARAVCAPSSSSLAREGRMQRHVPRASRTRAPPRSLKRIGRDRQEIVSRGRRQRSRPTPSIVAADLLCAADCQCPWRGAPPPDRTAPPCPPGHRSRRPRKERVTETTGCSWCSITTSWRPFGERRLVETAGSGTGVRGVGLGAVVGNP